MTGPGGEREEGDPVLLVRLLYAGGLEIVEDHLLKRLTRGQSSLAFGDFVDQFIILVHARVIVYPQE